MAKIPTPGSPGWVLVWGSFLLALIGLLFTALGIVVLVEGRDGALDGIVFLVIGLLLIAATILTFKAGINAGIHQTLFASHISPIQRLADAKSTQERELADKDIAEICQNASRLTSIERQRFDAIKSEILAAPSDAEVLTILKQRVGRTIVPANPLLEPIAFAFKSTTPSMYVKGLLLEAGTWVATILSIPFLLVWGVYGGNVWLLGKAVLYKTMRWTRHSRRYRVRAHNLFQRDARAPILYLRSFSEEYEEHPDNYFPTTSEEGLVAFHNRSGPMIALGRAKEELPLLGSARIYFDEATWKAGVLYLMSISQLVVIQAGIAPGLLWELGVAHNRMEAKRLAISFAAWADLDEWKQQLQYLRFKKYAEELFNCQFPPQIKNISSISFETGWIPKVEPKPSLGRIRRWVGLTDGFLLKFILPLVVALAVAIFGRLAVERMRENVPEPKAYPESSVEWENYSLGSTGISLDLLSKPEERAVFPPRGVQEENVYISQNSDLTVEVQYVRVVDGTSITGDEGLKGVAEGMLSSGAVSHLTYNTRQFDKGRFTLEGEYLQKGEDYKLRGYAYTADKKLWSVIIYYRSNNAGAASAAQCILDSVRIRF